jgi:hypothetical protein
MEREEHGTISPKPQSETNATVCPCAVASVTNVEANGSPLGGPTVVRSADVSSTIASRCGEAGGTPLQHCDRRNDAWWQ